MALGKREIQTRYSEGNAMTTSESLYKNMANKAWFVLKSHRLLAGESPFLVTVKRSDSRQPMKLSDQVCQNSETV